jgi:hypothetical protein
MITMKTFRLASLFGVQRLFAAAEAPAWQTRSFRLLDAATGAPLAGAKALVFPSMDAARNPPRRSQIALQRDPLDGPFTDPKNSPPAVADARGRLALPVPAQAATMLVMNDQGIAFLRERRWNPQGGDVRASLQAWASLSGTVTVRGQPAAGVAITFSRSTALAIIASSFGRYVPPIGHLIGVRTDQDGRFKIERLLPTAFDGLHEVHYKMEEIIDTYPNRNVEHAPAGGSKPWSAGSLPPVMELKRGDLSFAAGEHRDLDLAATPPCAREVSGRLVWIDGTPVQPADIKDCAMHLLPKEFSGMNGDFPNFKVEADGRFKASVPIAGKWLMGGGDLAPVNACPFAFPLGFPFVLPDNPDENGKGGPIDLGDIVFQKKGSVEATPPKPDAQGLVEIAFTLLDGQRRPLPDAAVKLHALVSESGVSSRYLYPKNLPVVRTEASGLARIKAPVTFRDENGKERPITGVDLELSHDGCETWNRKVNLGEIGAVFALRSAASVSVRVVKEGQPLPLAQAQMRVGWLRGADCFEHREWQASGDDGVLLRPKVPSGNWQVQAAHLDAEKWRWFSEITEVAAPGQKEPAVLTLRRGARVAGALDAGVPRPVRRGMVRVVVRTPPPSNPSASPILWSDWQPVDEDGRFVLRGLPSGDAWIAASCEGWISEPAKMRPIRLPGDPNYSEPISMRWSAVPFHVDIVDTSIVVPMIRTGAVVFHFKHADGAPVTGASPIFDAGLDLGPTRELLSETGRALDQFLAEPNENSYHAGEFLPRPPHELDATGSLRLENLPPTHLRIGLGSGGHRFSPTDPTLIPSDHPHDQYAPFQADVKPGEVIEKEFVVSAKE